MSLKDMCFSDDKLQVIRLWNHVNNFSSVQMIFWKMTLMVHPRESFFYELQQKVVLYNPREFIRNETKGSSEVKSLGISGIKQNDVSNISTL